MSKKCGSCENQRCKVNALMSFTLAQVANIKDVLWGFLIDHAVRTCTGQCAFLEWLESEACKDAFGFLGTYELRENHNNEKIRFFHALRQAIEACHSMAEHRDPLTKLFNRRYLKRRLGQMLVDCPQSNSVWLIATDIDHFKNINDSYGHQAGDTVLSIFSDTLLSLIRVSLCDFVARVGGEEFVAVVVVKNQSEAMAIAERFRSAVACAPVIGGLYVTASFGVAPFTSNMDSDLHNADIALYEAKKAGRNRVVLWEPGMNK